MRKLSGELLDFYLVISKGDFDGAMQQYLQAIGHLEPSYVIRKYLDAQRIHSLTTFLQNLHQKGAASADHTTLLLNCYTKVHDIKRLDEFIKVLLSLYYILALSIYTD
jgi:hypothetical protein